MVKTMDDKLIDNLKSESRWLRLLFMVLYAMGAYIAAFLVLMVAIIQAVHGFVKGEPNARLLSFSAGLNSFLYQVMQYLTYNSETKPFPFSDWPREEDSSSDDVN